jgi:hypothetical protein
LAFCGFTVVVVVFAMVKGKTALGYHITLTVFQIMLDTIVARRAMDVDD